MSEGRLSKLPRRLGFALVYIALALLSAWSSLIVPGLELSELVWLPSGVALAFIVQAGVGAWPWLFAAEAAVTLVTGPTAGLVTALGTGTGATTEAVLAALLLRATGFSPALNRWRDAVALIVLGAGASSLLGSVLSVFSLAWVGAPGTEDVPGMALRWWLSHANGILILTPVVLTRSREFFEDLAVRALESSLLAGAVITVGTLLFQVESSQDPAWLLLYAPFPVLLWAAFRFRVAGAAWANVLLASAAVIGTSLGRGPLVGETPSQTILRLSAFLAVSVLTSLVVAGIVEDREEEARARLASEEERRVLGDRMHQTQKLESLGVLAGGIAHDFNNLLATVMGNADLAERKLDLAHPAGDHVAEVLRASRRAADLCRQILAYAGRGKISQGRVDMNEVVLEMGELLSVSFPKDAVVEVRPARFVPPVWGDVTQLRQVVLNLLTNAADALPDGRGTVRVTTGRLEGREIVPGDVVSGELPPGSAHLVHFTVEDDGAGMDEEVRSRVFEPFYTTKNAGRGLGLAVVLGIVRSHQGCLELRTAPGAGSRFRVTLPVTHRTEEAQPESPVAPADLTLRGTCLLVDDEPGVRMVCRSMLEEMGLDVLEAVDGQDAMERFLANRDRIEVTLLDITMPRMDGFETLRAIRQVDPSARILLSTGNVQDSEGVELEWDVPLLAKPYGSDELRLALARVMRPGAVVS